MNDRAGAGGGNLVVRFWGVRGSVPVPGPTTMLFGGNTPCVEVRCGDRLFVLDGGTGAMPLGKALSPRAGETYDLFLTHCHHDHVQGIAFFAPLLIKGCTTRIYAGHLGGDSPEQVLMRMFSPPLFPVTPNQFAGTVKFCGFNAGEELAVDGIKIRTHPLRHPSGATAYRIDHAGRSVCYVTDVEHEEDGPEPGLAAFAADADLVIYDAMFAEDEFNRCRGWGHSTWRAGMALCRAAGASRLAAFHHHPRYDDVRLAELEAELQSAMPDSFYAREGQTVTLAAAASLAPTQA